MSIRSGTPVGLPGTSDDVELIAMSEAVAWTCDLLPQLAEVHIYSNSLKAIQWLFDASNHSSMESVPWPPCGLSDPGWMVPPIPRLSCTMSTRM